MKRLIDWFKSRNIRAESARKGAPFLDYEQLVHIDAENLAEHGVLAAYNLLLPRLAQFVQPLLVVTEEIDHETSSYIVIAGGRRYEIAEPGAEISDSWQRATAAFFEIVNASLRESSNKFYAFYGGHDLAGMFLTEAEFKTAQQEIKEPAEWPWMPVNEPPHFGYPGDWRRST